MEVMIVHVMMDMSYILIMEVCVLVCELLYDSVLMSFCKGKFVIFVMVLTLAMSRPDHVKIMCSKLSQNAFRNFAKFFSIVLFSVAIMPAL